jgi:hypothetical protein
MAAQPPLVIVIPPNRKIGRGAIPPPAEVEALYTALSVIQSEGYDGWQLLPPKHSDIIPERLPGPLAALE